MDPDVLHLSIGLWAYLGESSFWGLLPEAVSMSLNRPDSIREAS